MTTEEIKAKHRYLTARCGNRCRWPCFFLLIGALWSIGWNDPEVSRDELEYEEEFRRWYLYFSGSRASPQLNRPWSSSRKWHCLTFSTFIARNLKVIVGLHGQSSMHASKPSPCSPHQQTTPFERS